MLRGAIFQLSNSHVRLHGPGIFKLMLQLDVMLVLLLIAQTKKSA
jgi:hypothetical protein